MSRPFAQLFAIVLFMLPGGAFGGCLKPPAVGSLPLEQRFEALSQRDHFTGIEDNVAAWRALTADARRLPGDHAEMTARSLGWIAWSLDYLGKPAEALAAAREAQSVLDRPGRPARLTDADVLAAITIAELDSGLTHDGLAHAGRAVATANRLGPDSAQAGLAHNALGSAHYAVGNYGEAERNYAAARDISLRCLAPSNAFIVNQMSSHAGVLYMLGRGEEALAENQRAAGWALANLREDSPVVTLALGNLAVMLRSTGRYAEAEAALRRVVDLEARYQKESWFYRAISLTNFATVLDREGRHVEAEALWLKASAFHARSTMKRDPVQAGYPLRFSADAAQARGDLTLALAQREQALAAMKDAPADHSELARARLERGVTLALMGRAAQGLAAATPAIAVIRAKLASADVKLLIAEVDHARVVAAVRGAAAGYAFAKPAAALLETRLLDTATTRGDLVRYAPLFSASFAATTEMALMAGEQTDAFRWLQLANLSDIVIISAETASRMALGDPAARALMQQLQDEVRTRQALDRQRSFAAAAGDPAASAATAVAIGANDARIEAAAQRLDAAFPALRQLGRPEPVRLAELQARLLPGQVLVAPLPVEDGTLAILVTRDGLSWAKGAAPRWAVASAVERIRGAVDHPGEAFPDDAARTLYDAIVPPKLAKAFRGHRDMLYLASGPLSTLPPALLIGPGPGKPWLVRSHSVTVLTSLTSRGESDRTQTQDFLGVGAPSLGTAASGSALAALPPLPNAAEELEGMARQVGGARQLLVGAEATEAAVKRLPLARYGVVALATHGLAGDALPGLTEPALALGAGDGEDGLLTASEIARLRLDASWVVLSACDSANGIGAGAPAYSGLAAAFIAAGARSLLVSHWRVRDDTAQALTVGTMRGVRRGLGRAEALRRAMLALIDAGQGDPAIWAPFVLIER